MKYVLPVFAFIFFLFVMPICSLGQKAVFKGTIFDSVEHHSIPDATILLLTPDTLLVGFNHSSAKGAFILSSRQSGQFLILITHPQYEEKWISVTIHNGVILDTIEINMQSRTTLLEKAIVKAERRSFRIRGDTIEYDASNFKMEANANVEDLLKNLPGVQVDQKGSIVAQGQAVQKVLVDGEEFFSDDPTIVTRGLSANMIDKVQIFYKKSRQAEFTGIDDGVKTKTLNLTIREDRKHGWFNKTEAASDLSHYYSGNDLIGDLSGNRNLAAFGMVANTGQINLNDNDIESFSDGDGIFVPPNPSGSDNFGQLNIVGGIPKITNAGIHYLDKWNGDGVQSGQHVNADYRYGSLWNQIEGSSFIEQFFPDSISTQTQGSNASSSKVQHAIGGQYEFAIDSSSSIRIHLSGVTDASQNISNSIDSSRINGFLVNASRQNINANINNNSLWGDIVWQKRFRRLGGSLFAHFSGGRSEQHTSGFLYSRDDYFRDSGSFLLSDTIDERKDNNFSVNTLNGNFTFMSAINRLFNISATYDIAYANTTLEDDTWNKANGKYSQFVDSLSSQDTYHFFDQKMRLTGVVVGKKFNFTAGGEADYTKYTQIDHLNDIVTPIHYLNLYPSIYATYKINAFRNISFGYTGETQQPSIFQLQLLKNNNNPLHIIVGNPALRPAFSNTFNISLSTFHASAGKYLRFSVDYNSLINAISSRSYIDSLGRQITQSVNVDGDRNIKMMLGSSRQLGIFNLRFDFNAGMSYAQLVNFVNNQEDVTTDYIPDMGFSFQRYVANKYNFNIRTDLNYNFSTNSIDPLTSTHYWSTNSYAEIGWSLINNLNLNTNASYNWRQKLSATDNDNQVLLWNAFLDRRFSKEGITARFSVNDILNQNKGISTLITASQITQSSITVIRRYWMLSLIWNIATKPKP